MIINEKAPTFKAKAFHNGKIINIDTAKLKKWVVLFFYPADFTFVCPTELGELADHYDKIKKMGGEVLSISTDTEFVHKAWHDHSPTIKKIKFPMVADPTGKICRDFGTYIEEQGLSWRATIIIDPTGVVKSFEMNDNKIGRNISELLRKLEAAQYVAKNKGEVCPVNWAKGKKTMKPGLELVGKI